MNFERCRNRNVLRLCDGRDVFWGALWGLFSGGVVPTTPAVGPVSVLGYLTASLISALEGAIVVGGLSALGAAMTSIGVPKGGVVKLSLGAVVPAQIRPDAGSVVIDLDAVVLDRVKSVLFRALHIASWPLGSFRP